MITRLRKRGSIMAVWVFTVIEPDSRGKSWLDAVTVWALPRSTLVRVGIAHVRSSIYVAQPTSDSQFSAVLPSLLHRHSYEPGKPLEAHQHRQIGRFVGWVTISEYAKSRARGGASARPEPCRASAMSSAKSYHSPPMPMSAKSQSHASLSTPPTSISPSTPPPTSTLCPASPCSVLLSVARTEGVCQTIDYINLHATTARRSAFL
ncbi:hypothetical protein EJ02DRAFT_127485 [Clathrospora elynae]|uniref:Uncharacterized protein n=1 Tax=Clathrospora elynae TaxID=706981 RepID=A0A6A5S5V3_9PLEO|nr:hypothetical protein EJ02DRAFT_127485 [Clathrospora elynae]